MARKSLKRWWLSLSAESLNTCGGVTSTERTLRTLQITICQEEGSFLLAWTTLHRPSLGVIPSFFQEDETLTWRMTQCPPLEAFSRAFSATISWPCPKDTLWNFPESIVNPSLLPVGAYNMVRGRVNQGEVRRVWNLVSHVHLWLLLPPSRPLSWRIQTPLLLFQQAAFCALSSGLLGSISRACTNKFLWFYGNEAFDILIDGKYCYWALLTLAGVAKHCPHKNEQHVVAITSVFEQIGSLGKCRSLSPCGHAWIEHSQVSALLTWHSRCRLCGIVIQSTKRQCLAQSNGLALMTTI